MSHPNKPATSMTLREWYAGISMQGLLSRRWTHGTTPDIGEHETFGAFLADQAIGAADALIAELEKKT